MQRMETGDLVQVPHFTLKRLANSKEPLVDLMDFLVRDLNPKSANELSIYFSDFPVPYHYVITKNGVAIVLDNSLLCRDSHQKEKWWVKEKRAQDPYRPMGLAY